MKGILIMSVLERIKQYKLLPVIKLDHAEDARPLAEALCGGGLPAAEITFRTDAASESIRSMSTSFPQMLVGAGSISSVSQAQQAADAGAQFLVSAGVSRKVIEFAIDHRLPIFPGICTPTELMILMEYELPIAKFFPAEQFGGLNTIKALSAPFPSMRFMPTGGINPQNIMTYLASEKVIACGGSWMVKDSLIQNGDFQKIQMLTQEAVTLVKGE